MKTYCLMLMAWSYTASAAPYTPTDSQAVIASWQVRSTPAKPMNRRALIELAQQHLNQANQVGNSHLYGQANALIKPLLINNHDPDLQLLMARIEQHQHQFEAAINRLNHILTAHPQHNNANLMAARIHIIKRNFKAAKQHCLQLTANAHINLSAVCLLEVASHQGKLSASYALLSDMYRTTTLPQHFNGWIGLMLSDMAIRLGQVSESEFWLEKFPNKTDVSYLTAWAETKLALNKPQAVLLRLSAVDRPDNMLEDSILLQLALAEKSINELNRSNNKHWQNLIKQRVMLREQRQDTYHASELAHYYLHIENNRLAAKKWAKINWQQAQEHKDQLLLNAALNPVTTTADEVQHHE